MNTIIKSLLVISATLLLSPSSFAQWSILSTSSVKMEKQTSDSSKDFWLHVTIKNDSKETQYIWGQRGFHIIEAFIKNAKSKVWERQNMGICGTMGEPSWQEVMPGQEIKILRREAVTDVGKDMMLTFQASSSPNGRLKNSEVLLGSFNIPKISETRQAEPKLNQQNETQ